MTLSWNVCLTDIGHFLYSFRTRKLLPSEYSHIKIMNGKLIYTLITVICASIFSSCVPYDENGRPIQNRRAQSKKQQTVTDKKQQEIEAKREELHMKEEARKKDQGHLDDADDADETLTNNNPKPRLDEDADLPEPPNLPVPPRNHPVAAAVPGKPGFVFSPFNNKVVDVRNIPSGTLVADPQYPASEKKHFRVP
jgi:hypothetical protein